MILATLVVPSVFGRRARPMLWDDFDLGAAGVGEADRFHAAFAGDVDAFAEDADGGEECPVDPPPLTVQPVGELADGFASFGYEVVAAQPRRPYPVGRDMAAGIECSAAVVLGRFSANAAASSTR